MTIILIGYLSLVGCNKNQDSEIANYKLQIKNLTDDYNEAQNDIDILVQEKQLLSEESINLIKSLENKTREYNVLKETTSLKYDNKKIITYEEFNNLVMSRFSAIVKLRHEKEDDLETIYAISSEHTTDQGWYILKGDLFEIELLGYSSAKEVKFYYTKLETCMGERLLFEDTSPDDGWIYSTDGIGEIFEASEKTNMNWPSTYIIYAEVKLANGKIKRTSALPLYNVIE
jgi:hypothetical protein